MAAAVASPDLPWFVNLDQATQFHAAGVDQTPHVNAGFGGAAVSTQPTLSTQPLHQPPYRAQAHNITRNGFRFNREAQPFSIPGAQGAATNFNPDAKPFAVSYSKLSADAKPFSVPGANLNANAKPFSIPSANGGVFKFNAEAQPFAVPGSGPKLNAYAQPFEPPPSQAMSTPSTSFNFNANAQPFEVMAVARLRAPSVEEVSAEQGAGDETPAEMEMMTNGPKHATSLPGIMRRNVEEVRRRTRSPNSFGEQQAADFSSELPTPAAMAAFQFLQRIQAHEPRMKPVPRPIETSPPISRTNSGSIAPSPLGTPYHGPMSNPQPSRGTPYGSTSPQYGPLASPQHAPAAHPPTIPSRVRLGSDSGCAMLTPSSLQLSPTSWALRTVSEYHQPGLSPSQDPLPSPAAAAALKFIRRNVEVLPEAYLRAPGKRSWSPGARSTLTTSSTATTVPSPGSSNLSPLLRPSTNMASLQG